MTEQESNSTIENKLQEIDTLRLEIDRLDRQLIILLANRMQTVTQIGEIKQQLGMPPLQPSRWQNVLNTRMQIGESLNLNPEFIHDIWERIHIEALELEK
jgi:chorismate mutase-like protein